MANVNVMIWTQHSVGTNGPNWQVADWDMNFSRVPSVGELVALGNDADGVGAHYVVRLVVHMPEEVGPRDAEIYLERVDDMKCLQAVEPGHNPHPFAVLKDAVLRKP